VYADKRVYTSKTVCVFRGGGVANARESRQICRYCGEISWELEHIDQCHLCGHALEPLDVIRPDAFVAAKSTANSISQIRPVRVANQRYHYMLDRFDAALVLNALLC